MRRWFVVAVGTLLFAGVGVWVSPSAVAQRRVIPVVVSSAAAGSTAVTQEWSARYDGATHGVDEATAQVVTPDGRTVIVTGVSVATSTGDDYATVAYDAVTGARKWVARYDGAVHGADVALAAVVTPDGATVIVTGYSANTNPDFFDYATVAYDTATGARKWLARYHGPNGPNANASAYAAVVTPDGAAVIVTGSSRNATGGFDYATVAYDTATGARKWVARYDGGTAAKAIAVTPDGATVIVTGYTVTIAYDATTGAQKWVAGFGGDFADAVVVTPDAATVIVTGNSASSSSNYETVAYDTATGVQKWVADYNGPGHGEDDARAAVVTPDSATVIVTGGSFGKSSSFDYATVAYDAATGVQRWVARYDGPAHAADIANAAAVTPDGTSVIVTGDSQDAESSNDWETVAYNTASGAKQWSARHDAHEPDGAVARAVMLTPDGATVVVTGDSADPTGIDYRTIAYHL